MCVCVCVFVHACIGDIVLPVYQMCELLHYFCDCELKHRIEAIASFSDSFVSKLQFNQKFRYNELMLALNMSAAITARKTKEFRSPPQEQVSGSPSDTTFCPIIKLFYFSLFPNSDCDA